MVFRKLQLMAGGVATLPSQPSKSENTARLQCHVYREVT